MTNANAPRAAPLPEFLTTSEAATVLRCSPETIQRRIAAGRLAAVRDGRCLLIPRTAIDAIVAAAVPSHRTTDAAPPAVRLLTAGAGARR